MVTLRQTDQVMDLALKIVRFLEQVDIRVKAEQDLEFNQVQLMTLAAVVEHIHIQAIGIFNL